MEELVGKLWHRFITRAADHSHAEAAVSLDEVTGTVGILFRALGGDGGLEVATAEQTPYGATRGWLARIASGQRRVALAWRDAQTLRLPERIALFPDRGLNRDLYLWLAALAAAEDTAPLPRAWLPRNQELTRRTLARFPGMAPRYRRLVAAHLPLRPAPDTLPPEAAAQEQALRAALREPGAVTELPLAPELPEPVPLWLHPSPPLADSIATAPPADAGDEDDPEREAAPEREVDRRRSAEVTESPEGRDGLLGIRMENIFSWAEYVKVDRTTEEDDSGDAARTLDDMERLSVARDNRSVASRLRFDLDLPAAGYDDLPLGEGIPLPEWDYRRRTLLRDHCRLQLMEARDAQPCDLPPALARTARKLRTQFEALAPARTWYRGQAEGSEVDLDAYLHFLTEKRHGRVSAELGLYRDFRSGTRDLACLLLADLSLSTDASVNDEARIIDVIRDSMFLFAESLSATGDRFALYGFSSRHRSHVRFQLLKGFDEAYSPRVRGRIAAVKPGYYTRMGAAIRHATTLLSAQTATRQLLLLITDGKPNDLDHYEGRYGIEDTRMAILEARRAGLFPFCVTVDREAGDYLPHLFGPAGFIVIRRPEDLPRELPLLYMRLTA